MRTSRNITFCLLILALCILSNAQEEGKPKRQRFKITLPPVCDTPKGKELPICHPEGVQGIVDQYAKEQGLKGDIKVTAHDEI